MTLSNNYDPTTAASAYYTDRTTNRIARFWANEKLLHDLKQVGLIDFFEGPGTDPTSLAGYNKFSLWLQVEEGVTEAPGTIRAWDRSGTESLLASWPAVTPGTYLSTAHLGTYEELADLIADRPTGQAGDWAILTHGASNPPTIAIWDSDASPNAWVDIGTGLGPVDWTNIANKADASTTVKGIVEIGTSAEMATASGSLSGLANNLIPNIEEVRNYYDPLIAALSAREVMSYETRTAFAAATVDGGQDYVLTAGYAAVGDGGGALYKRVGAQGTPTTRYHQSADGAWWELVVNECVYPQQVGAAGDGVTDDTTTLGYAAAIANDVGVYVDGMHRTYVISGTGLQNATAPRRLRNITVDMQAVTTSKTVAGQTWVVGIDIEGGAMFDAGYTDVCTTSGSIDSTTTTITVDSSSPFAVGDAVVLHAAEAWGASSSTSYKAEGHIVKTIPNATSMTFEAEIEGAYNGGGTAAKIIKYPEVDIEWRDVHMIGAVGTQQHAALFIHCRYVRLERCSCVDTPRVGFGVFNCYDLYADGCRAERVDLAGFGYGLEVVGTNTVTIGSFIAYNCRHGIASGGGLQVGSTGRPINRRIVIGTLTGYGMTDAIFDCHPGVKSVVIGTISSTFIEDAATTGDGVLLHGGGDIQIGQCRLYGFRRHGVLAQTYGDGDGGKPSISIDNLIARSDVKAFAAYGFAYDDSTATTSAYPHGTIRIGYCDISTTSGIYMTTATNNVNRVIIGGGYVQSLLNTQHTVHLLTTANGRFLYTSIFGLYASNPVGGSGYAFYYQGVSGSTIGKSALVGCNSDGGAYGLLVTYGVVDRISFEGTNFGTAEQLASTGGTINTYA